MVAVGYAYPKLSDLTYMLSRQDKIQDYLERSMLNSTRKWLA